MYRDDGLACFGYTSGPEADRKERILKKIFREGFDISITYATNLKAVNFLDVTLNLKTGKYKPYNKSDNNPLYINILSNHTPNIIKNLPDNNLIELILYQHMKQHLIRLRIYITMHWPKLNLNIRLHFKNSKIHPQ